MSTTITLSVPGISCAKCQQAIEGEVGALPGVSVVHVDIPAKTVAVTYDAPAGRPAIDAAIEDAGYDVAGTLGANAS